MKTYSITKCKNLVYKILKDYPETRDCDQKLIARLWLSECAFKKLNYDKILEHLYFKRVTSPTSIIRVRRLLQNENKELRGEKYNYRKTKLEPEVREEIKNY